ncbi:MAG: hypothetical protein E7615_04345 [Ruminococcaceae bacterium]|nr:hypothetical protein [Oscillospiraceae bacterium]
MELYLAKQDGQKGKKIALDDMILTKDMPTTAGSKMLENYMSLFDAEVVERLTASGYAIGGKANVGEMCIDLLGETSYYGAVEGEDGTLMTASAMLVKNGEAEAAIGLDANGTPRRAAALNGLVCIKPTYGTVSRFGTVSIACSGETVTVTANDVSTAKNVLDAIVGHDDKDGTSLPEEKCAKVKAAEFVPAKRVAVAKSLTESAGETVKQKIAAAIDAFKANGIEVVEIDDSLLLTAKNAWNILMSAELCNNVSRYDGVKYGYRTKNYTTIDELYTNSRTEAFGELLKTAILFGSETLSDYNYMKMYDKGLRIRRVLSEKFDEIFESFDAILMPVSAKSAYTKADTEANKYIAYDENLYTAPATITGIPAVIAGGVQLLGKAFSENVLLDLAKKLEGAGK